MGEIRQLFNVMISIYSLNIIHLASMISNTDYELGPRLKDDDIVNVFPEMTASFYVNSSVHFV